MKRGWMSCFVFLVAIVSGVLYCLYLQRNNLNFFKVIYKGILMPYEQKMSGVIVLKLFMEYIKKLCIVFVLGSFSILLPLGFVMMFIIVFSYSFTISCFITLYGLKGTAVSFLLYGIQSILLTISGFYILNYREKKANDGMTPLVKKKPVYIAVILCIGVGIVVGLDVLNIVNFNMIKQLLL